MKLLITGATGFLGRHVVQAALAHGYGVRALVRPVGDAGVLQPQATQLDRGDLEIVRHDLRNPHGLAEVVRGVDAVLHLAAAKTGSFYAQMAGTVIATENLLAAMRDADVDRLVLVSSFSVYDYLALARRTLDEISPLEAEPEQRDDYCRTKLLQERLAREAEAEQGVRLTVLRPGVIYAEPDDLWTDRLGVRMGNVWLATGSHARLPLVHVRNCAEAIVLAGERDAAVGQTLNLVDDDPPTQRQYRRALRARTTQRPRIVPINWTLMRLGVWAIDLANRRLLAGQARLPAILRRRALHARCRPLRYTNQRACDVLGWSPRLHWRQVLTRDTDVTTPASAHSYTDPASPVMEPPCASRT